MWPSWFRCESADSRRGWTVGTSVLHRVSAGLRCGPAAAATWLGGLPSMPGEDTGWHATAAGTGKVGWRPPCTLKGKHLLRLLQWLVQSILDVNAPQGWALTAVGEQEASLGLGMPETEPEVVAGGLQHELLMRVQQRRRPT